MAYKKLNLEDVSGYVEKHIGDFHRKRLKKVDDLRLKKVLATKNPYLFKAKNVTTASEIIEGILSAYISSGEETSFGDWLERLAIFINDSVYGGAKAAGKGTDLDFIKDGERYIVAIKSGPNWGNDAAQHKLADQFNTIRKSLSTSGAKVNVTCVNGCCYGRSKPKYEYRQKFNYYKICGQRFWELISGEADLYTKLIIPLGHQADEKNKEFKEAYGKLVNKLTKEFLEEFCTPSGEIDWDKLVKFNSGPGIPVKESVETAEGESSPKPTRKKTAARRNKK